MESILLLLELINHLLFGDDGKRDSRIRVVLLEILDFRLEFRFLLSDDFLCFTSEHALEKLLVVLSPLLDREFSDRDSSIIDTLDATSDFVGTILRLGNKLRV